MFSHTHNLVTLWQSESGGEPKKCSCHVNRHAFRIPGTYTYKRGCTGTGKSGELKWLLSLESVLESTTHTLKTHVTTTALHG